MQGKHAPTGKVGKTPEVLGSNKEKLGSALMCRCIDASWAHGNASFVKLVF
jgi:hypothetical protein